MLKTGIIALFFGPAFSLGLHLSSDALTHQVPTKIPGKPIVDMVLFNGEHDMFALRANELSTVVDLFMVFEGICSFTGIHKEASFNINDSRLGEVKNSSRIVYTKVPCFTDPVSWNNEMTTRSYMQTTLPTIATELFGPEWYQGAVMVSDVDELPVAKRLQNLFTDDGFWWNLRAKFVIHRVRGQTFYWNTRCMLNTNSYRNWKGVRIIAGKLMKKQEPFKDWRARMSEDEVETNRLLEREVEYDDGLSAEGKPYPLQDLMNYGWHFSFFMSAEETRNKIVTFSHTEYAKPPFTDLDHIRHSQENCLDPFDRAVSGATRVPEGKEGSEAMPWMPDYLKEAAGDGRLPKYWLTGVYD